MTSPEAGIGSDAARWELAQWCARLGELLADVARQVARLSELIGAERADDRAREWADRTALLSGGLHRDATSATELGADLARRAGAEPGGPLPGGPLPGRRSGMRLGGVDAARATEERGIHIAELPPP